jgi:phage terminase small subunit
MGKRGRKSAAELATVGPGGLALARRPEPPAHLGDDAAAIWRAITNSLPANWFSAGTLPLLEALCGLTVSQRCTLRALQVAERGGDDFDRESWEKLQKQLGEVSGRIATLATRLRLTPQSRYGARAADTAARTSGDGPKPWEF